MTRQHPGTNAMARLEARVLEAIDMDALLVTLCELIAIPSVSGEESAAQERVADLMADTGLAVDRWELDFEQLKQHPQCNMETERERGLGVVGVMGQAAGGRRLILNGHTDVVPAGSADNWTVPPWQGTIRDGRVYGRGSVDMKGGLCAALYAAKAIHDAGARLQGQLLVESVIGEEDGGVGTLAAIQRGYKADGAIVVEPTELAVAPAQAGALSFRVTVPGLAAHGCVREEGVSAIDAFLPVYRALVDLESERNSSAKDPLFSRYRLPYALCIGRLEAGEWPSSVAESLVFEGRYGIAVGEDALEARRTFEETIARAAAADPWLRDQPPTVDWWGGQFEPASIPPQHPLVLAVSDAFESVSGNRPAVEGITYGADMRLLVNVGETPTVLFGPGDVRQAHRPDEFVPIDELETAVRTLALAALRFCGAEMD